MTLNVTPIFRTNGVGLNLWEHNWGQIFQKNSFFFALYLNNPQLIGALYSISLLANESSSFLLVGRWQTSQAYSARYLFFAARCMLLLLRFSPPASFPSLLVKQTICWFNIYLSWPCLWRFGPMDLQRSNLGTSKKRNFVECCTWLCTIIVECELNLIIFLLRRKLRLDFTDWLNVEFTFKTLI